MGLATAGSLCACFTADSACPVWRGGQAGEEAPLKSAYRTSLGLAADHHCRSIALPALSTGAYCYPLDEAAHATVDTAVTFLRGLDEGNPLVLIRFVLFSADAQAAFEQALSRLTADL